MLQFTWNMSDSHECSSDLFVTGLNSEAQTLPTRPVFHSEPHGNIEVWTLYLRCQINMAANIVNQYCFNKTI